MKVTAISAQQKNPHRVNVMIDGVYRLSLDIAQITELGVKVGKEYTDEELVRIESESEFGKLYSRALEYCLVRPRSVKEVKDYLWRKTRSTRYRSRTTGEVRERSGVSGESAERVLRRLQERGCVDDHAFARYWAENRNMSKGASRRKLQAELQAKGVDSEAVAEAIEESGRTDSIELEKIIAKKQHRYPDRQKFMMYLVRQGFSYDDVRRVLDELSSESRI